MKRNLKIFLIFVIGILIGAGSMYAASTSYTSDQVLYEKGGNLQVLTDTIDDIYSKISRGNATPEDIAGGKSCVVQGKLIYGEQGVKKAIYLGQGTSFNLSSYNGYQNFTSSNFLLEPVSFSEQRTSGTVYLENDLWAGVQYTLVKNYNPSTGVLTGYGTATGTAGYDNSGYRHTERSMSVNGQVKAYLLLNNELNETVGGDYTRLNVVYLGQGQTFNLTTYGYSPDNYSNNSFIVEPVNIPNTQTPGTTSFDNDLWAGVSYSVRKSYTESSNTFSTYGTATGTAGYDNSGYRYAVISKSVNGDMKTYLILNTNND